MRTLLLILLSIPAIAHAEYACPDYASEPAQLRGLEEYASRGALNEEEKACLEQNYEKAEEQTVKDKISRVLMINGYAYSTDEWARLVERHLDEVDQSDPDIAYLYAYHLFNTDPDDTAEEVIQWTEKALERKDTWKGDIHVSRVYGLMRLRAFAAAHVWKAAEEGLAQGSGDHEAVDRMRNEAKTHAREWVDMARSSGRSPQEAFDLCITMASAQACGLNPRN